jgi:lysylphosphatidylglycerol synthetase-like protein (DUF2156 family)
MTTDAPPVSADADYLVIGGKLLALITVLLPVAGFVTRWVAFGSNPTTSGAADTLAWSAPIGQLAATGLPSVVLGLAIVVLVGLSELIERISRPAYLVGLEVVFVLAVFALAFVIAPWPIAILFALTPLFAIGLKRWERQQGQLTYQHGWLLATPIMLVGAAILGLYGTPTATTVATYTFTASTHLSDVRYAQLGDDGSFVFLESCNAVPALVLVAQQGILVESHITAGDLHLAPSVAGVVFEGHAWSAGYQTPC